MKPKIFIDGSEGTTGLQIYDRLSGRADIELLQIGQAERKSISRRKELINAAGLVFLCLPDEAAEETVSLIENPGTRILDASSAHRVADGWIYGLPELSGIQRENIKTAQRVSNPGCHATGAILLLAPLLKTKTISSKQVLSITSVTGYTGGGKKMISEYESPGRLPYSGLDAPRLYSACRRHKHIPEIVKYTGLKAAPPFMPIVAGYPQGMQVIIPLGAANSRLRHDISDILSAHYENSKNIELLHEDDCPAYAASNINAGSDRVTLKVLGFDDIAILTAQFDNLGKGASGAAVQNMNIMLGFDEYTGLKL